MGMPAAATYWTAEMVRALPEDGNRYEVVYGELLVTPSPRPWHEIVVMRLIGALGPYLGREPVGLLLASRGDISWDEASLVQPDVYVVDIAQARRLQWAAMRQLLLVAEVLSPSSVKTDRFLKRRRYQEAGVGLYWIVDADARQVEVWTPDVLFPTVERERLVWHPAGAATAFRLELEELFRPL
jgi:Uma2 family endonuclease